MDTHVPSRPQSSYERPRTAVARSGRSVARPASALPAAPSPSPSPSRPTATTIVANALATHFSSGPGRVAPEIAFRSAELQNLFRMYARGGRPDKVAGPSREPTHEPLPTTTVGGVKRPVVVLRPKSARPVHRPATATPAPPATSTISTVAGSHHRRAFGRSVYTPNAEAANVAPQAHAIFVDDEEEVEELGPDTIPIPASVAASARRGGNISSLRPTVVSSWHEAAEQRGVPLEADREQRLLHASMREVELARRRLNRSAAQRRDKLEQRDRPWREGDIHSDDARWTGVAHHGGVRALNASLDEMLRTWRGQRSAASRREYEHLPERQPRRDPDTGEPVPQVPSNETRREERDMLYGMMRVIEDQMAELEVYNQIFARITRPYATPSPSQTPATTTSVNTDASTSATKQTDEKTASPTIAVAPSETLPSVVCPSLPLCDLLDRIRVAHSAVRPRLTDLFVEVRRRLKFEWTLDEMGRRRDTRMVETQRELDEWQVELDQAATRADLATSDLARTKASLASRTRQVFFDAPQAKPNMVYDTHTRRVEVLDEHEAEDLARQPVQWFGEREADEHETNSNDHSAAAGGGAEEDTGGIASRDNGGTTALTYDNDRAQRYAAKIATRLADRRARLAAERTWRRSRIEELRRSLRGRARVGAGANGDGSNGESRASELRRLLEVEALEASGRGEESTRLEVSSSDSEVASEHPSDDEKEDDPEREKRLAQLSSEARARSLYDRATRAVSRALTTRPLLAIRSLESGARVSGRVFCNSDYYAFDLGRADAGVWVRLFATESGNAETHIELQLACSAPPTRRRRFFVTSTRDDATHCAIDLRAYEMRAERDRQDEAAGRVVGGGEDSTRWFLRVLGRGLAMKPYALEFRVHATVLDYSRAVTGVLDDLETQTAWQRTVTHKALVVDQLAHHTWPDGREKAEKDEEEEERRARRESHARNDSEDDEDL